MRRRRGRRQCGGQIECIDDRGRPAARRRGAPHVSDAVRQHDGQLGLAVRQQVGHLVVAIVWVDGHDAGAQAVERQVMEEEFRPVFQKQRDAMARAVARRRVPRLEVGHRVRHRGVAEFNTRRKPLAIGTRRDDQERQLTVLRGRRRKGLSDRVGHGHFPWVLDSPGLTPQQNAPARNPVKVPCRA